MASLLDDLGQPKAALSDLDAVPAGQLPSVMSGLIGQLRARLQSELGPSATGKHDEHDEHVEHVERLTRQSLRPSGGW